jgi:hypothetical protein
MKEIYKKNGVTYYDNGLASQDPSPYTNICFCTGKDASGMCRCEKMHEYPALFTRKTDIVALGQEAIRRFANVLAYLHTQELNEAAQDAIEGRTRHNPQGNSRFKGKDNGNQ